VIGWRRSSRRAFLGGAGAVLALPWLESAFPARVRAQNKPPTRFLAYYVPNGIRMSDWTPSAQGASYPLPKILASLAPLQDQISVLTGLANKPAKPDGPGDHASGTAAFMTNAHPFKTEGADIANGVSLDQHLAEMLGGDTTLRSLQLGIDGGSNAGGCDSGYSCAYTSNVSWAGPATPLPKLTDPRTAFDRLFAGLDPQASQAELGARLRRSKSLLDYVLADAKSLGMRLGSHDRRKLDEYMSSVRELELRLDMAASSGPMCDPGMSPSSDNIAYPAKVLLMSDLMVLAFQCDVTRFTSFMLGNAGSNRSYDFIGVSGAHHEISHHMDVPEQLDKLTVIDTWEVEQLMYLLTKMAAIDEGGESLLHHSLVFFSSEIEDGNSHAHVNMPILLAGAAGGAFSPGKHIVWKDQSSIGKLFVSILQAFGLSDTRFGVDGDGALTGLG
jgi:hypothetical protein